jgi:hypothetical protein
MEAGHFVPHLVWAGAHAETGLDVSKLMLYLKEKRPDVFVRLVRIISGATPPNPELHK